MYMKQALGADVVATLGQPPSTTGTAITFTGTKTGEETKTIGGTSVWDDIWSATKEVGSGLFEGFKQGERAKGAAAVYAQAPQPKTTPSWVVPVVIGGLGLVAVARILKKKSA